MASTEPGRNPSKLNDNEKAKVDTTINHANAPKSQTHQLARVAGALSNHSLTITLFKTLYSQGHFVVSPPKTFPGLFSSIAFMHQGAYTSGDLPVRVGSKAAIMYVDLEIGYLLSWYRSDNADEPSKVYVEVGSKDRITKMEWTEIEEKLGASHASSRSWDSEVGAAAAATIEDVGRKVAWLVATFEITH